MFCVHLSVTTMSPLPIILPVDMREMESTVVPVYPPQEAGVPGTVLPVPL